MEAHCYEIRRDSLSRTLLFDYPQPRWVAHKCSVQNPIQNGEDSYAPCFIEYNLTIKKDRVETPNLAFIIQVKVREKLSKWVVLVKEPKQNVILVNQLHQPFFYKIQSRNQLDMNTYMEEVDANGEWIYRPSEYICWLDQNPENTSGWVNIVGDEKQGKLFG